MIKIIAIIGKAGSGKDTLLKKVLKKYPDLKEIVSCTTRPPRENEVNGVDYHFLTDEQFANRLSNHQMLEYTSFNSWFYGTEKGTLDTEKINIGVFNPTGIRSLLQHSEIKVKVFYINASDKNRLIRQLTREENPLVDEVIRRYRADDLHFDNLDFSYHELVNDKEEDLEIAASVIGRYIEDQKILNNLN